MHPSVLAAVDSSQVGFGQVLVADRRDRVGKDAEVVVHGAVLDSDSNRMEVVLLSEVGTVYVLAAL